MSEPSPPIVFDVEERLIDGRMVRMQLSLEPDGAPEDVDPVRECELIARELQQVALDVLRPLDGEVVEDGPDELEAQFLARFRRAATAILAAHGCEADGVEVDIDPVHDPLVDSYRLLQEDMEQSARFAEEIAHTRIRFSTAGSFVRRLV
jgi:hypothetical protein